MALSMPLCNKQHKQLLSYYYSKQTVIDSLVQLSVVGMTGCLGKVLEKNIIYHPSYKGPSKIL